MAFKSDIPPGDGVLVQMVNNHRAELRQARYSILPDGTLKWKEVRDLEQGWQEIRRLKSLGKSQRDIAATTHLPVAVVASTLKRWASVAGFPTSQDVLDARVSGFTVPEIARRHNCTSDDIKALLEAEIQQMEGPAGQYAIEVARCERFFKVLEPMVAQGSMNALATAIRISEHKLAVIQTQIEAAKAINGSARLLNTVLDEIDTEDRAAEARKELPHEEAPEGGSRPRSIVEDLELDGGD